MGRCRGEANQSLYRARTVLKAWDYARGRDVGEEALVSALLPAVRSHLRDAYGWFLLAVSGVEDAAAGGLPGSVADVPAPQAGQARPPELVEFARLEGSGWLAEVLDDGVQSAALKSADDGLIGSDRQAPGYAVARDWCDKFAETMMRMDDSLNEC